MYTEGAIVAGATSWLTIRGRQTGSHQAESYRSRPAVEPCRRRYRGQLLQVRRRRSSPIRH